MGGLDGRVALVTGAGGGHGRAYALRLAEAGADVIALDLCAVPSVPFGLANHADLDETASQIDALDRRVVPLPVDLRDPAAVAVAVRQGVAELGRLDTVVSNACVWSGAPFVEMGDDAYRLMIDVQIGGAHNICQAATNLLIDQGRGGSVVIVNSTPAMRGLTDDDIDLGNLAVIKLMRSMADGLAPHHVRVNTIHPDPSEHRVIAPRRDPSSLRTRTVHPIEAVVREAFSVDDLLPDWWVEPVDISRAVTWLATDDARHVTGVTFPTDAGLLARRR